MKKIVKIAVIAVVVILAIALIAPAALRGKIADIVKREANAMLAARLDFEKLDISLLRHFPNASVELKGLTLVGVDRFEGDTIVAARRISVVVNLMSLFGDSGFEVTKVILASPAVHAHKLADGAVSWDVMKPSEAPAEEVPAEEPAPSSFRLSVRDFRISDAAIRYEDDSTNMRFSTAPLSLRLRGNMSADRTDLDLLFGCLIDWGLPLSLPYKSEQIDGCTVHTYNDGDLIACFDTNIPESVVKEIAQRKPLRAVFRDSGFASSPEKINVFEIFKLYMPEDANDISKRVRVI